MVGGLTVNVEQKDDSGRVESEYYPDGRDIANKSLFN